MSSTPAVVPSRVAIITLGCARNEVDSEELAGRLAGEGWSLVEDPADADAVLVNTCGFVEAAKKDSIDTLLHAADLGGDGAKGPAVIAVGCLAERYGETLAESLPEADAVLGFDDYPDIAERLRSIVAGTPHHAHTPRDRRLLLPITPVQRQGTNTVVPGHGPVRTRLQSGPVASIKLASGCDRRCSFCAIPSFRGSYVSRLPDDLLEEARWLAGQGVRELVLVSENSTSYGKDLGDPRALEALLPQLGAVEGILRVRPVYLQPAEMRPGLVGVMTSTPGVAPYFDLSFQHASPTVLRRMRRFGGTENFLDLLAGIRERSPQAGVRANVIVGFPGETEADIDELEHFLTEARLDVVGVFGYSDEDGTEAAGFDADLKLDPSVIQERLEHITTLVEELTSQRAEDRIGETVEVLVETVDPEFPVIEGRAAHQAPEVDGSTVVHLDDDAPPVRVGDLIRAVVVDTHGVDLIAE